MASIKKNYLYSIIYQFLNIGIPVVTVPYVSRVFGPEKLGLFSFTNTIGQYFVMFSLLGLANYGNREIAAIRDDRTLRNKTFCEIYFMQIISSLISVILYCYFFVFQENNLNEYYFILLLFVISPLFDVNWFFWGLEEFGITVFRNSVVKIITFISILVFVKSSNDLGIYLFIYSLSALISVCLLWPILLKRVTFVKVSLKNVLCRFKPNIMLFIPILAISIYKYMDRVMLGNYSFVETGYYDNSEKIITLLFGFIISLGTVMLPRICYLINNGQEEIAAKYTDKSLEFVMFVSIGMAFGLSGIANSLVPFFLGDGFEPCIVLIGCLAPTLVFCSWANVIRTQILIPYKKDNIYIISVVVGAIVNFVINIILIPIFGAMGAVIGTIIAEFMVAFIQTIMIRRSFYYKGTLKKVTSYIIIGLILLIILKLEYSKLMLHTGNFEILVIQLITGIILYSLFAFSNRTVKKYIISLIKKDRLC